MIFLAVVSNELITSEIIVQKYSSNSTSQNSVAVDVHKPMTKSPVFLAGDRF